MNFLENKSLLIVVIILIVAVIGFVIGFGGFFYWHKTNIPADNLSKDISQEEIKAKCLENASKITDQELINEIKNLEYIKQIASADEEDKLNFAIGQTTKYLNCKLADNKDEQLYNTAKAFIQGLIIEERGKKRYLSRLDEIYSGEKSSSFVETYAFKSIEELCPNGQIDAEFLKLCLTGGNLSEDIINKLSPERRERDIKNCYQFCEDLSQYIQDPSIFENELNDFNWYPDSPILYCYKFPVIIAFIAEGKELALKTCDSIPVLEMKELCKWDVEEHLSNEECTEIHQELINIICEVF